MKERGDKEEAEKEEVSGQKVPLDGVIGDAVGVQADGVVQAGAGLDLPRGGLRDQGLQKSAGSVKKRVREMKSGGRWVVRIERL